MEKETVTKYFEQAISSWLDKEKANDELFADQVKASGKTVEVNMKTWSIVQSRGLLNDPSERHDEIIELVKRNMNKLKIA